MTKIMKYGLLVLSLLIVTGCQAGTINTVLDSTDDVLVDEDGKVKESITSYFEREEYSTEERDEMFYIVENHSDDIIEVSEFYFVQKLEDEEWITVDNNTVHKIDNVVRISPHESSEFVFWLSFDSIDFESGTYRLYTRINFVDESEESSENESDLSESVQDMYIPFEIL